MKYTKAVDIIKADQKALQPGQWVYAGDNTVRGQFLGVAKSGTIVICWSGHKATREKLMRYAKA
jgi:hypothetical protein